MLAWPATRYGRLHVAIIALHLNKRGPSIDWRLEAKGWREYWRGSSGKRLAREIARANPLSLLTLYLGDGCKHPESLAIATESRAEYYEITVVPEIVRRAYETGYGKLLDAVKCDKWLVLKNLMPSATPCTRASTGTSSA